MAITGKSRAGRALTPEEHKEILEWNLKKCNQLPQIELALNYPETPEMFGIVETGQIGPTLFLWAAEWGVVIEPFSGGSFIYPSLAAALRAIRKWSEEIVAGKSVPFGT